MSNYIASYAVNFQPIMLELCLIQLEPYPILCWHISLMPNGEDLAYLTRVSLVKKHQESQSIPIVLRTEKKSVKGLVTLALYFGPALGIKAMVTRVHTCLVSLLTSMLMLGNQSTLIPFCFPRQAH